jgi:hypothetical protein
MCRSFEAVAGQVIKEDATVADTITRVKTVPPSEENAARVKAHLIAVGWTFEGRQPFAVVLSSLLANSCRDLSPTRGNNHDGDRARGRKKYDSEAATWSRLACPAPRSARLGGGPQPAVDQLAAGVSGARSNQCLVRPMALYGLAGEEIALRLACRAAPHRDQLAATQKAEGLEAPGRRR